jgi:hypothetical protein
MAQMGYSFRYAAFRYSIADRKQDAKRIAVGR